MLKCRDVPELATDYMEGGMGWRTRVAMGLHLLMCSMCRAYLDQLRKTRAFLARQPMPGPAAEVEDRLVRAAAEKP